MRSFPVTSVTDLHQLLCSPSHPLSHHGYTRSPRRLGNVMLFCMNQLGHTFMSQLTRCYPRLRLHGCVNIFAWERIGMCLLLFTCSVITQAHKNILTIKHPVFPWANSTTIHTDTPLAPTSVQHVQWNLLYISLELKCYERNKHFDRSAHPNDEI